MSITTRAAFDDADGFDGLTVEGLEFSEEQPFEVDIDGARFLRMRWIECRFEGLRFTDCVFEGCSFDRSVFEDCTFESCRFYDAATDVACSLRYTRLEGTRFERCDLTMAGMERALVYRLVINGSNAQGLDARFWDNGHAVSDRVRLAELAITDTNLAYADFSNAMLDESSFSGSRLSHALLNDTSLVDADLTDTELHNAEARHVVLRGADLRGAEIAGLDPRHVDLEGVRLSLEQLPVLVAPLGLVLD